MAKVIAVTGKGGTGKTVVAALIVRYLKQHAAGPVLALDADPDTNLATVLNIPVEKTIGDMREDTLKEMKTLPAGMSKSHYIEAGLHEVIVETEKVDLITMGRSEGPGCYCFMNSLLRKFTDDLQAWYEWVVMDNEAGLEHLSRRTASHVDHLVAVVNSNPLTMDCAKRIDALIADVQNDVAHRHFLVNRVTDEVQVAAIKARMADLDLAFLGAIPDDEVLNGQILSGQSLYELDGSPAVREMDAIMERLTQ